MSFLRRHVRLALVILLLGGLAACGSPEERIDQFVEQGNELIAEGDYDRAVLAFRNALKIDPRHAPALLAMGRIHEQREAYPRAFAAYREAAEADPSLVEAHAAYAVLALTGGELDFVRRAIADIQAVDPENADALALEAALALRESRLDEAEQLARRALATDPAHVNATSALAGVQRAAGQPRDAVAILDDYFAAHGGNVPLALLKVQLLAAENDHTGVVGAFGQLIEFAPDNAGFRIALADYYRNRGDQRAAEEVLRTTIDELDAPPSVAASLVRLINENDGVDAAVAEIDRLQANIGSLDQTLPFLAADLYLTEERFDEAAARLQAVVDATGPEAPRSLDAVTGLASVARARGNAEDAGALIQRVLDVDAEHRGANYLQAVLDISVGRSREAIVAARAALGSDPNWVPALKVIAEAHRMEGQRDLAIDALRRAVQEAPNDIEGASALANLLAERGDFDASLRVWDLVIESAANPMPALSNAAEIAIRQEDWNRAGADIDRLLATPGAELSGTLLAGSMRLAQGDAQGAREWFERAAELDPAGAAPLLGLVRSYLANENLPGALALLDERVAAEPGDAVAHNLKAQLHVRNGQPDLAEASYRAAIAAQPAWPTPYAELANLAEQNGRVGEAIAILDEGMAAGAGPARLQLLKAFALQRAARYEDAIATYAVMLEAGNDSDIVVNNYAALVADFAYDEPERLQQALELAQRFGVSTEGYFIDTLGWLHYRTGDHPAAVGYLRRAVAVTPNDPQIRYHFGAALHAIGNSGQALAQLEQAVVEGASYAGLDDARRILDEVREAVENGSAS